jgi:YggT family protein
VNALQFLVNSIFTFVIYAFLLRVLLQLVRADFRNPLSQAILALTNWLVLPLRRILPPIGRFDTASFVALFGLQFAAILVVSRLFGGTNQPPLGVLAIDALISLVVITAWFYIVLIFIYALLSFIAPRTYNPVVGILTSLCEPVLAPLRRILPVIGGLDFSPLVAIVLLRAFLYLIN